MAAVEHGLRLTALRPIVPSLDDIYRTAVERPPVKPAGLKRKSIDRSATRRSAGMSAATAPTEADRRRRRPPAREAARPARRLAGHRGQGARRPPAERPVHRAAHRARPGGRDPALLRRRPDPRGGAAGERRPVDLPRPVHGIGSEDYPFLRVDSFVGVRGAAARPGLRLRRRSTASDPRARCRGCWPSRSIATTSSTASSPPGWRSSGSSCWRSSALIAGFGIFRLGIVPESGGGRPPRGLDRRDVRVRRAVAGVRAAAVRRSCRRAATSALIGFGIWFVLDDLRRPDPRHRRADRSRRCTGADHRGTDRQAQTQQFISRLAARARSTPT